MLLITHGNTPVTEPIWGVLTGSRNPREVLQSVFGHTEFRTDQILNGEDVIAVIPTDGGKTVVHVLHHEPWIGSCDFSSYDAYV